ncbi:MAG: oligosaccharide flippase family protein [Deltaproteobacteria bacterium]|nr:oligosaccharide flippase family protein [Deltaproteobacteria bacterium]
MSDDGVGAAGGAGAAPEEGRPGANEARSSVVFLAVIVVGFGITTLQNFYFAYVTDEHLFGEITLLLATFLTLNTLFLAGLESAIIRFYFDRDAFASRSSLLSHLAAFWAVSAGLLLVPLLAGGYLVLQVYHLVPLRFFPDYVVITVGSLCFSFVGVFQNVYIASKEPWNYGLLLIVSRLLLFVGLAVALPAAGGSTTMMCVGALAAALLSMVVSIPVLRLFPLAAVDPKRVLRLASYTVPLGLNSLGGLGFSHGYKVILASSLTFRDLGLYNIATQFSSAFYLVASSLLNAYTARAYSALEQDGGRRRAIRFYLVVVVAIGLLIGVVSIPATYVFLIYFKHGAFRPSFGLAAVLIAGQFAFLLSSYPYILITHVKRTVYIGVATVAGVAATLVIAHFLLGPLGTYGAAIATSLGLGVLAATSMAAALCLSPRAAAPSPPPAAAAGGAS